VKKLYTHNKESATLENALDYVWLLLNTEPGVFRGGKDMSAQDERRTTQRVEIPAAQVFYKKDEGFELFKRMTGPMPLRDLGTGGICFEVEDGVEWGDLFYGDPIYVEILMPDRKKVQVRGNIRWISGAMDSDASLIGIEFMPFGERGRANSTRSRKKIEKFTIDYN